MSNNKVETSVMLKKLFKSSDIKDYVLDNEKYFNTSKISEYLNTLCVQKNKVPEKVILKAGIERTYGHQFFNGKRKPSRDKVIQLAFGFEMDFEETQEFLKHTHKELLYPKVKRDAVIIFALKHSYSIIDLQLTLKDLSLPLLGKED